MKIELKKPRKDGKKHKRPDVIRIDPWDTWDVSYTAARILEPMLVQYRNVGFGVPVSMFDPDDPKDANGNHNKIALKRAKKRWDKTIDEMIWAMRQCHDDTEEMSILQNKKLDEEKLDEYYNRIQNGLKLFAEHFHELWW